MDLEQRNKLLPKLQNEKLLWTSSPRHGGEPDDIVRWLPVTSIDRARIRLGISNDGWWVIPAPKAVTELRPGTPPVFLLPVLEVGVSELKRTLSDGLASAGVSLEWAATFPFEQLTIFGLTSQSDQWANLALAWSANLPASAELIAGLEASAVNGPTQKFRQVAKQLASAKTKSAT